MKALTVRQPWASLIAEGIKTVETRSWSTRYRGPIAIHAGAHRPFDGHFVDDWFYEWATRGGHDQMLSDWDDAEPRVRFDAPLCAVVATANLVDCVSMVPLRSTVRVEDEPHAGEHRLFVDTERSRIWRTNPKGGGPIEMSDQFPFGDFTPGRFAWLLDDVVKLDEPIPAKGRQGLWNWDAALVAGSTETDQT